MELKQYDTNFSRIHYIIESNGIRLRKKSLSESSDTFVAYEDVGSKIIKESSSKLIWLILSCLFFVFGTIVLINRINGDKVGNNAEVFHFSVTIFFLFLFFITKKNVLYLTQDDNTGAIEFIAGKRYKEKTDNFIKCLIQTRDKYLIETYSNPDEFLPYDQQYNNLVWLYNLKLLTKQQLKNKIAELEKLGVANSNGLKNNLTKITGFKRADDMENETDENEN